jgi:cell division protein ZapE
MTTPLEYYQKKCQEGFVFEDPHQLDVLRSLQCVYQALLAEDKRRHQWFSYFRKLRLIKGLYLWGGVGVGKTFLMDCFYHSLPFQSKKRMHFHEFMQQIHDELVHFQGKKDPVRIIGNKIASQTLVLCFDEFHVTDITDAMLLGQLFSTLFLKGVCLVATSNIHPDNLYKNGLQRERFIPAIKLIKANTDVIHIPATVDYRLRHLKEAGVFYTPLGDSTTQKMNNIFNVLTEGIPLKTAPILMYGRPIKAQKYTSDVIWFEFAEICSVPRSQRDYLAIAKQFKTVFISNIPIIEPQNRDTICLFINLVDVFYDARVRLVISAAESVEDLYNRGHMIMEYTRTHSRLLEMQSQDYFAGEFNRSD